MVLLDFYELRSVDMKKERVLWWYSALDQLMVLSGTDICILTTPVICLLLREL